MFLITGFKVMYAFYSCTVLPVLFVAAIMFALDNNMDMFFCIGSDIKKIYYIKQYISLSLFVSFLTIHIGKGLL